MESKKKEQENKINLTLPKGVDLNVVKKKIVLLLETQQEERKNMDFFHFDEQEKGFAILVVEKMQEEKNTLKERGIVMEEHALLADILRGITFKYQCSRLLNTIGTQIKALLRG